MVSGSRRFQAGGEARPGGGIGPLAWLLLAAAGIHFLVHLLLRGYPANYGFPPEPWAVLFAIQAASAFGLAAAVIIGAGNWPRGRPWLLLGAGALVLHGALSLLGEGMMYWVLGDPWETSTRATATEWISYARAFVAIGAAAASPILLAVGLWRGAQTPAALKGWRWLALALGVVTGLLALIAASWLAVEVTRRTPEVGLGVSWEALSGIAATAWVLLGATALRAVSSRAPLPEALISVGALLAAAGASGLLWAHLGLILGDPTRASPLPSQLATLVNVVGLLLVGVGFASGRLVPPADAA